jgi:hypothetical protein
VHAGCSADQAEFENDAGGVPANPLTQWSETTMRKLLCLATITIGVVGQACLPTPALPATGSPAGPNALSPKEASAGWLLLFDGQTTFGWQPLIGSPWTVQDGALVAPTDGPSVFRADTAFADFILKAEMWTDGNASPYIRIYSPPDRDPAEPPSLKGANLVGPPTDPAKRAAQTGRWVPIEITAQAGNARVRVAGGRAYPVSREGHNPSVIALCSDGKGTVRFRGIKLQPIGLKSIFNGKDLTGWKVIPGHASVYSVTPQGWLNVKNGNGDIQTEGTYKDFVLQLEIISNGPHLNSGVFFRAIPGEFWSGYESQIRNQWEDDDRTKPVDYGTGAIYGRQAARKVVSSDNEWFTMTIVAHGPHMSVWVNGYQVSDWTDNRPPARSGRQGYRAEAGVISLQGHDPTTDLSFRNIRIAEMP